MSKIRIVINGIGTVGKRIAHAVKLQDDMELVAISDVMPTPTLRTVLEPNGPLYGADLYASNKWGLENLRNAGMYVNGTLEDLLKNGAVDVVVEAQTQRAGGLEPMVRQGLLDVDPRGVLGQYRPDHHFERGLAGPPSLSSKIIKQSGINPH